MAKSLREQLMQIALKKVKMSDGKTVEETMASEARRLYDCIQYHIDAYYLSYQPKIYERTDGYRHSLYAEDIADIRIVGDTLRIGVGFNLQRAMHPNLSSVYWNDYDLPIMGQHETFVPLMMEMGWYAPKLASMLGKHVYRLTYFEGVGAVEEGIKDFNRTNKYGIKINADDFFNGKAY